MLICSAFIESLTYDTTLIVPELLDDQKGWKFFINGGSDPGFRSVSCKHIMSMLCILINSSKMAVADSSRFAIFNEPIIMFVLKVAIKLT